MAGIYIPSTPEDVGALAIGKGGTNRGNSFPNNPEVGEYFYREDLDILFAHVFDERLATGELDEFNQPIQGLSVWTALESFSNAVINIYASEDGVPCYVSHDAGYSMESPTNCALVIEHLIPKRSRSDINVYVWGMVGWAGVDNEARIKLRTAYIGQDSGGDINFLPWPERAFKQNVGDLVTVASATEGFGYNTTRVEFAEGLVMGTQDIVQLTDPSNPTVKYEGIVVTPHVVVRGMSSDFTVGKEFHISSILNTPAGSKLRASIMCEGNSVLNVSYPMTGGVQAVGLRSVEVASVAASGVDLRSIARPSVIDGIVGSIESLNSSILFSGLCDGTISVSGGYISITGTIIQNCFNSAIVLSRSDAELAGLWSIEGVPSIGSEAYYVEAIKINRWSSLAYTPYPQLETTLSDHIMVYAADYSIDSTINNGIIIGV